MSTRHQLSLEVIDSGCPTNLKISDTSFYAPGLAVDCPRLDITVPGFPNPVYVTSGLYQHFIKGLSAFDLELQTVKGEPLRDLPDGLYKIAYSVSPNDYTKVEYYYLRQTLVLNKYAHEILKVQLAECEPSAEQHERLHQLRYIKLYLDAAKAKAEYAQAPAQAIALQQYAERLLHKLSTSPCHTC